MSSTSRGQTDEDELRFQRDLELAKRLSLEHQQQIETHAKQGEFSTLLAISLDVCLPSVGVISTDGRRTNSSNASSL